ncbi:MAG: starch-binding protein [Prevotella sp.]|jgi:alpha-amylase
MKKLLLAMMLLIAHYTTWAQGWPENYDGVMLQGFYWDSYDDSQWSNLESQADELSKYFDLIWVPQSGYCNSTTNQMGYAPIWWFDHKSAFGTEAELRSMIATYKSKGVGIIEDVVINHRSGNTNWCDFPTETWGRHTMTWSLADICNGDDGGDTKQHGYAVSGANDTGDDFKGSRDLDHTSANVQKNIKLYLDFLLNDLGYTGFRYDMVKGYAAEYVGMYNASSKPRFSVGEYWDSSYDNVTGWINGTKRDNAIQSAAFDFPLKSGINASFGSSTWDISNKGIAGSTTGMNRYSVTFVDNHDTYRNNDRLATNVLAANAFILAMPGTPCIFLPHWKSYKTEIGKMILARKAAGLTNQSNIVRQEPLQGGYVTVVQGKNAQVMVLSGYPTNFDTSGFTIVSSGTNYAYYVSNTLDVSDIVNSGQPETTPGEVKIHVNTTATTAPYLYAWDSNGTLHNGDWPGTQLSATSTTADGKTWYDWTSTVTPINIIFNSGNGQPQTENIKDVSGERFYTIDPGSVSENKFGYNDVTAAYIHPGCAEYVESKNFVYFEAPADWQKVCVWIWSGEENLADNVWPGDEITQVGTAPNGNRVYVWTHETKQPANILFNNGETSGTIKTTDLNFVNGRYYNVNGLLYTVAQPKVTISAAGYATFSCAQAIDFSLTEGLTAYIIVDNNGEEALLQQVEKVPANTGVVLKGEPGTYVLHPTTEVIDDVSANLLKATSLTEAITTEGTAYVLAKRESHGVGFYKLENGGKVYKDRAYLTYNPSQAKLFIALGNGEVTGIRNIGTTPRANKGIYTLSGVRLNDSGKLSKGIYIINGKKYIIK